MCGSPIGGNTLARSLACGRKRSRGACRENWPDTGSVQSRIAAVVITTGAFDSGTGSADGWSGVTRFTRLADLWADRSGFGSVANFAFVGMTRRRIVGNWALIDRCSAGCTAGSAKASTSGWSAGRIAGWIAGCGAGCINARKDGAASASSWAWASGSERSERSVGDFTTRTAGSLSDCCVGSLSDRSVGWLITATDSRSDAGSARRFTGSKVCSDGVVG